MSNIQSLLPTATSENWGDDYNAILIQHDARIDTKADINHTHTDKANAYHQHPELADVNHEHDISDINDALETKADKIHQHNVDNIYFQEKQIELEGGGVYKARQIPLLEYLRDTMTDNLPMSHTHDVSEIEGMEHIFRDLSGDEVGIISTLDERQGSLNVTIRLYLNRPATHESILSEPFLVWEYSAVFDKMGHSPYVDKVIFTDSTHDNTIVIPKPAQNSTHWDERNESYLVIHIRGKHSINGSVTKELHMKIKVERPSFSALLPTDELINAMLKNPEFLKEISKNLQEPYKEPSKAPPIEPEEPEEGDGESDE